MTVKLRVSSVEGVSRKSGALEKPGKIPWRQRGGSWTGRMDSDLLATWVD